MALTCNWVDDLITKKGKNMVLFYQYWEGDNDRMA